VATQAGFAPEGFVSMFDKLQQSARLNDSGNFPYLRSHPLSTERMADMQARIGVGDLPESMPSSRQNVSEFDQAMLAARAQVISHPAVDALRAWAQEVEPEALRRLTPARQLGALYGATLAAIRLHEYTNARQLWLRLSAKVGNDAPAARLARLLGVELLLAQNDGVQAAALLRKGEGKTSTASRAELLLSAQAGLHGAPKTPVVENLQTWVASHARDAQAWQLLSLLYTAQGQTLGALRAQAEVSVAQLDFPAALQRFKSAQEWVRKNGTSAGKSDHIEASIIDTRTREMELLIREQALER
jgi:predicted Zn-dependent protease